MKYRTSRTSRTFVRLLGSYLVSQTTSRHNLDEPAGLMIFHVFFNVTFNILGNTTRKHYLLLKETERKTLLQVHATGPNLIPNRTHVISRTRGLARTGARQGGAKSLRETWYSAILHHNSPTLNLSMGGHSTWAVDCCFISSRSPKLKIRILRQVGRFSLPVLISHQVCKSGGRVTLRMGPLPGVWWIFLMKTLFTTIVDETNLSKRNPVLGRQIDAARQRSPSDKQSTVRVRYS